MQTAFEEYLLEFVRTYKGPKLAIVATGGGIQLGNIAMVPGGSSVLHSFHCPYETQESVNFIERNLPGMGHKFLQKAVSADSVGLLYKGLCVQNAGFYKGKDVQTAGFPYVRNLAVTAACTTSRFRRGENQAFVAFQNAETQEIEVWHLKLPKRSEEEHKTSSPEELYALRRREDETIAGVALWLACGLEPETLEVMEQDGFLSRVDL